jgi:aryl carrier-like protein
MDEITKSTLAELCDAISKVIGTEETEYLGQQDYLVLGEDVNRVIKLVKQLRDENSTT